jgi:hypothetical protein
MTLSSLFLRLFIFGGSGEGGVGAGCLVQTESGAHPPHFLFARGSRGGRLGLWSFQVRRLSIQLSSLRAAEAAYEKNNKRTMLPRQARLVRPFGVATWNVRMCRACGASMLTA